MKKLLIIFAVLLTGCATPMAPVDSDKAAKQAAHEAAVKASVERMEKEEKQAAHDAAVKASVERMAREEKK